LAISNSRSDSKVLEQADGSINRSVRAASVLLLRWQRNGQRDGLRLRDPARHTRHREGVIAGDRARVLVTRSTASTQCADGRECECGKDKDRKVLAEVAGGRATT
jgi:hypothetical protein